MSEEKELNFYQKAKIYWRQKMPWGDISDIAKGMPDKKNYGPWAWVGDGAPPYYMQKVLMIIGYGLGIFDYFVNSAVNRGTLLVMPEDLNLLNMIAIGAVVLGSFALIQYLYDSHRGTFDHFQDIWEPWRVWDLDGSVRMDINRIYSERQIWDPTVDNAAPKSELDLKELEFDKLEIEELEATKDMEGIIT